MIQVLVKDFEKEVGSKWKHRNDPDYIEAGRRYLREVLVTVKEMADGLRDSIDNEYQKIPFDKSCDAINVLLYNHLDGGYFNILSNGTEEEKKETAQFIENKHETFTV
jgi:hypothetical protein